MPTTCFDEIVVVGRLKTEDEAVIYIYIARLEEIGLSRLKRETDSLTTSDSVDYRRENRTRFAHIYVLRTTGKTLIIVLFETAAVILSDLNCASATMIDGIPPERRACYSHVFSRRTRTVDESVHSWRVKSLLCTISFYVYRSITSVFFFRARRPKLRSLLNPPRTPLQT